jgi:hypothetical protein
MGKLENDKRMIHEYKENYYIHFCNTTEKATDEEKNNVYNIC